MLRASLSAALVLTFGLLGQTSAAPDEFDPRDHRRLFSLRDTNAARHTIAEARLALSRGQTVRALHAAQRVLDEMTDDFFLEAESSTVRSVLWRSAPEVVREILEGLDADQQQAYEEMARPNATPLLNASLSLRDERGLREILRRYGASSPGVEAARLLADIALEAGRWREAERYSQEGLRFASHDAGLWARLIDALAASGDSRGLERLEPPADLSLETPGRPALLRERKAAALAALPAESRMSGWPMWGGVPARNAQLTAETPIPTKLRWIERTDFMERRNDRTRFNFRSGSGDHFEDLLSNTRPLHPVVQGRTVYVADGRSVSAYDVYSGRKVWVFDGDTHKDLPLAAPGEMQYGRTSLERAYAPVVADDLVIATVEVQKTYRPEYLQAVEISSYLPRRILVALDRETGSLRWAMGQSGMDALTLTDMSIVSSPAVAEGLVVAVGSVHRHQHNVSFLGFDLRTGALRWRRPLGFGSQELNLFGYPVKELAASPVAVADGVAYASTGLGFVAAVDIRSGIPRWLASYEIIPVKKVQLWYSASVRMPKMAPAPPVVHGDLLVVAPTDGRHVHAFDRRTGQLKWREGYVTDQMVYDTMGHFLGVANDGERDVVLLTDHELRARDLKTGRTVWYGRFEPEEDRVLGRGAVAGDDILIPTHDGLQRFSLRGDGAFRGTAPWPKDKEIGNLLPLGRVLLMTSQDSVQWFYDWAAIERDVERRRRERPDDPTILLEAGEMYLRGGGETTRARKAFEEALAIAAKAGPAYEARARRGLMQTWRAVGDQRTAFPAVRAFRKALGFAQTAWERVDLRLRIHDALGDDRKARLRNLEGLVDDAEDARAVFDQKEGEVPARAAALFLLASEHLEAQQAADAVDAYQRILKEERAALFPDGPAYVRAREAIGAIISSAGAMAYRRHEKKAREMLAGAERSGDPALLERLLDEYPNAAVVPEALVRRARGLLSEGNSATAARYLRRLLAEAPDHKLAPAALAGLVQAYRAAGAFGAARFALSRLAETHRTDRFRWDGNTWTGASFAAAEEVHLGSMTPSEESTVLRAPLREVAFEQVGEDEFARPVNLVTDPTGSGGPEPPPVALMMRGRELVAIDLRRGKVGWSSATGPCQRAAYHAGVLVLALSRELRGLDAKTGEELWSLETQAVVRDLQVAQGQVFALVQELTGLAGRHRLTAIDAFRGEILWNEDLGREDYRRLTPWRDQVLLQHFQLRRGRSNSSLLVFDGFSGARRHRIPLQIQMEGSPVIEGALYCLAGRSPSGRVLAAFDLEQGTRKWEQSLAGRETVCGLAADGKHLLLLRGSGSLVTHGLKDGVVVHETRIFVGDAGRACPFPGTPLLVDKQRVSFFPWVRRPALSVVAYDRRTGKLVWEVPYAQNLHPSKVVVIERGGLLSVMISYPQNSVQQILIRLIDAKTGKLLQEIEPEGLSRANWIPSMVEGHGTLVVFGKSGASIFRGAGRSR